MMRAGCIAVCAAMLAGCGGSSEPAGSTAQNPAAPTQSESSPTVPESRTALETMEIEGPEFRMYDPLTASADGQTPTFYVRADSATSEAGEGWQMQRPRATIYGEDDQHVNLSAESGVFDEKSQVATLSGGVTSTLSKMKMSLESIHWDNKERLAYSETAVHLEGDIAVLDAEGIEITPGDGTMTLSGVTGRLSMGGL